MTPESFAALSTHDQISYVLTAILSEELGIPVDEIKPNKNFQDYGADSIADLKMTRGIEEMPNAKVLAERCWNTRQWPHCPGIWAISLAGGRRLKNRSGKTGHACRKSDLRDAPAPWI